MSVSGLSIASSSPFPAKYTRRGAETGVLPTDEKWHLGLLSSLCHLPSSCNGFT